MKLRQIITKRDCKDKQGWTIPKGTTLHIIKELRNPITHNEEYIVYVDNGTGILSLMPKTLVEKKEVI